MVRFFRQLIFVVHAFILRWPIWIMIWIVGRSGIIKNIFLVYPTDREECLDFCPNNKWLLGFLSCRPTPAGLIMNGRLPIGIYLVIPNQPLELMRKKNRPMAVEITRRLRWIKKLAGAKTIGLAGQLGPIFEKRHNIAMEPPFYSSTFGNIYSIEKAINYMIRSERKKQWQVSVSLIGGGELGEQLESVLSSNGYQVEMLEVRYTRKGNVRLNDQNKAKRQLSTTDMVINLLPKGQDFMDCGLQHLIQETATLVDFSRPPIPAEAIPHKVVMGNRVQRSDTRFIMKLQKEWQQHELPACCMPSLIASLGDQPVDTFEAFQFAARQYAFHTAVSGSPIMTGFTPLSTKLHHLTTEFPTALRLVMLTLKRKLSLNPW